MQRASGDERTNPSQGTSPRAAVQLVRLYSLAFLLLSIAVCYATLRPSSSRFVLSPTILSSLNFLQLGSDPFMIEKSALETKLRKTYCHKMCLGKPSSSSQQCSLCRLKVKKQSVGDALSLLGYSNKDSGSEQQLFSMNSLFPLTWFPQDDGGQVVEDADGVATPLAAITPREEGGDWTDHRPLKGDPKARQERIEWESAKKMRWEKQGTDPQPWSGDLEGALDDGFLSPEELPPRLLHQRIDAYCTTRFPSSEWQARVCFEALLDRVQGHAEPAHVRLNWDDETEHTPQSGEQAQGQRGGGVREAIGEYVAALCSNIDALSAEEERALCPNDEEDED